MKLKGLSILVTGGAGFIGSHLVDKLLDMDNVVIAYDNFDGYYSGKDENVRHNLRRNSFKLVRADILDYSTLLSYVKGVDIVFHLAAQPGVRYSMENPVKTHSVNTLGTLNVLRCAMNGGVKRVVYASSSSTYGNPSYMPIDEGHPKNPVSIYGATKLAAEIYCKVFYEQFDLPVVILRYFTVYGPRQRPDMAIHKWTKAIFEDKPIVIYGDGNQTRDFTYIDDIIDGTISAAETDGIEGETINLGGGSRTNITEVVKSLIELSNVDNFKVIHEPPKLGDVYDTHADITKAKKLLGFKPNTYIRDGLTLFIEWYKGNKLRV
jgi:UDP-glucose 4-epimerase